MGKKGSNKKAPHVTSGSQTSMTLREESRGKKQTNINSKSILKLQHIKNLAVWASGEASIPSLGAFFGHRLAARAEALGTPPDPSLFPCQRCESILQPGYNCTIRIEKNREKVRRRRKKANISTQNNVVYKCHFCLHRNLKRGTPRGHMKDICPPKAKPSSKSELADFIVQKFASSEKGTTSNVEVTKMDEVASSEITGEDPVINSPATPSVRVGTTLLEAKRRRMNRSGSKKAAESESTSAVTDAGKTQQEMLNLLTSTSNVEVNEMDEVASPEITGEDPVIDSPTTPSVRVGTTLLEAKRRRRNKSGSKKAAESESSSAVTDAGKTVSTSNKRRRKSWTSLKEIAESSVHDNCRNFTNLTVPFFMSEATI